MPDRRKAGLVSVSFRKNTPEEIIAYMKRAHLTEIEWGSDVHAPKDQVETLLHIRELCDNAGIHCCSYGTYMTIGRDAPDEILGYIRAASILGCRIIRLWCGKKSFTLYTEEEKEALFADSRRIAELCREWDVRACMECHHGTFTDTPEGAEALMKAVHSDHFGMYWQPNQFRSEEENLAYARRVRDVTSVVHVFNWAGDKKFPLSEATDIWKRYLEHFDPSVPALLEFMPDGRIESLETEAAALRDIIG